MSWVLDIRIRYKILFLSVMGISGILIYFAYNYSVASANAERLTEIRDIAYPMLENTDINLVRLDKVKGMLIAAASEGEAELVTEADVLAEEMQKTFVQMAEINRHDAKTIKTIQREFSQYFTLAREMTAGIISGSLALDQIQKKAEAMNMAMKKLQDDLQAFREKNYADFTGKITETDEAAQQALMFGLVIGVVVLISLLIATPLIISMITGNLNQVIGSLKEMATGEGDLTRRLESRSNDELGELAQWFNRFVEQLQSVIAELKNTSVQLSSSASEVSVVIGESSQQVTRQESETELVATAINEMAATVQEVANHANNAAIATQEADQEARQGQQIVSNTVNAIDALSGGINNAAEVIQKLESDSQEIGTVLDVIRGIAEQTNLLALNAAIEAARAGDQGRGFAVVADEVRTLASRTQESTQEIDQMIERLQGGSRDAVKVMNASREQAQDLVDQAAQAGESLQTITQAVDNITEMNLQIASATEEQSNVALGIDASIATIRDISVETAQGAEQASTSSEKVAGLADKVQHLANRFKV
ncbi:MAG TPA: methyl-accepting chemotaxis protein [Gammaproteobacteria bacterium]|nr:methyl-accepting chemotaxis protein [Gammaproteobacteria bacterium]